VASAQSRASHYEFLELLPIGSFNAGRSTSGSQSKGDVSQEITRLKLEKKLSKQDMLVSQDLAFPNIFWALTMQEAFNTHIVQPVGKEDLLSVLNDVMSTIWI
jgi:hypothetical protein